MTLRFRPKLRVQLADNKRVLDYYADLAGKPRLEPHLILQRPVRTQHRNESRISEADVNEDIRAHMAAREDLVLWRNTRGVAVAPSGERIAYGVGPNGASDWIGYKLVEITEGMVGLTIAQFVAVEAKAPDARAPDDAQIRFVERVNKAGGRAIVARSKQDMEGL